MDSFLQYSVLILTGLASLLVIGRATFSFASFIHKRVREWRARRERERVEWERVEEKRRRARMALQEKERARREQMKGATGAAYPSAFRDRYSRCSQKKRGKSN